MSSIVKKATCDFVNECIEIVYDKYKPGTMYTTHVDYIYSTPIGDWTELEFTRNEGLSYVKFLDTMITKNLDACKRMARLVHEEFLLKNETNYYNLQWLAQQLTIIDNTFACPEINPYCRWQKELILHICKESAVDVISTCRNRTRLYDYFIVVLSALKVTQ